MTEVKLQEEKDPSAQLNYNRFSNFYPQFNGERTVNFQNQQQMPPFMFPYQNYMGTVNNIGSGGSGLFQNYTPTPNNNSKSPLFETNVLF